MTPAPAKEAAIENVWARIGFPPEFTGAPTLRSMGVSAGELHGAVMREIRAAAETAKGDPVAVTRTYLARLQSSGLIQAREVDRLAQICKAMVDLAHGQGERAKVSSEVRNIYHELLGDAESSPVALAIAGIATDSVVTSTLERAPAGAVPRALQRADIIDMADVGGAIVGAGVGGAAGGVGGAIAGAVIGGIGASAAAIFATK